MHGKTKSSKIVRNKKSGETKKKRGGFLGVGTLAVNITTEGIVLNELYRNKKKNYGFNHELLGLKLKFTHSNDSKFMDVLPFYRRSNELGFSSIIDNKIIDMLRNKDILCSSMLDEKLILFKFRKDTLEGTKKISFSRMFKSNWYSVEIILCDDSFEGFATRSPEILSTIRNLLPGKKIDSNTRVDIVNKYDSEFWFNFKPYFDINEVPSNKQLDTIKKLNDIKDNPELNNVSGGLNFMHELIFTPTTVTYGAVDLYKNQILQEARRQPTHRSDAAGSGISNIKRGSEMLQHADAAGSGQSSATLKRGKNSTNFSEGLIALANNPDYVNRVNTIDKTRLTAGIKQNLHIPAFAEKVKSIHYSDDTPIETLREFFISLVENNKEIIKSGSIAENENLN